jgi:hypothetical protein
MWYGEKINYVLLHIITYYYYCCCCYYDYYYYYYYYSNDDLRIMVVVVGLMPGGESIGKKGRNKSILNSTAVNMLQHAHDTPPVHINSL